MADLRTYCIFEGGGAKGYAHAGVLKAVEEAQFPVVGYAGTSAGAIIATLAYVGWTSHELIDAQQETHLVGTLFGTSAKPFDLLGIGKDRIRRMGEGRLPWRVLSSKRNRFMQWIGNTFKPVDQVLSAASAFLLMQRTGLSDTRAARRAVEHAIAHKIGGDGRQTFRALKEQVEAHLDEAVGADFRDRHLKIIAANISRRSLMLFSAEETPNVAVADAVAASIAIPGIFEPVDIDVPALLGDDVERCTFVDGGLVSNLPAWVFDSERAIDREAITMLSEITDSAEDALFHRPLQLVVPLLRTAIFGASRLNVRNIGRTLLVQLKSERPLLDFEPKWADLARELRYAYRVARQTFEDDSEINFWLKSLQQYVETFLSSEQPRRVRVSLATSSKAEPNVPEYADDVVQLRFCQEYEDDPDYRQVLSYRRSLLGQVMEYDKIERNTQSTTQGVVSNAFFIPRTNQLRNGGTFNDPRDKKRVSQIPPDVQWWIIIPFRSLNRTFPYTDMALCIDGSHKSLSKVSREQLLQSVENYVRRSMPDVITGS